MSNCLYTEKKPFASISKKDNLTFMKEYEEATKPRYEGKDHWLSWFKTDGGQVVEVKERFYIYLGTSTWREVRWFGIELQKLGAIFHKIKAKDESDGFRDWFWFKFQPEK